MAKEEQSAWKFFVALGIISLIVISVSWYNVWQTEQQREENTYEGYSFMQSGEFWITQIQVGDQLYNIPFYYHPRELEDVIVNTDVRELLLGEKPDHIFISIDPDAGSQPVVGAVEISRITGHKYNLINVPTSSALTRPAETQIDIPVVTCADAGNGTVVIQFAPDPTANAVVRDDACIILFYKNSEDSIRVADRFAYQLLQIMP